MRTLIYKRIHKGDPDKKGWFGINDCMGRIRGYEFDAVIGIGGISARDDIAGKLNWIGIDAQKKQISDGRRRRNSTLVTFDHFVLDEEKGRDFQKIAPNLARRMYSRNGPRYLFNDDFNKVEQAEVDRILKLARNASPSQRILPNQLRARKVDCDSKRCIRTRPRNKCGD